MAAILTSQQMRQADQSAISVLGVASLVLMENAARSCAEHLARMLDGLEDRRVVVLCGKGNNGGDGLAIARLCRNRGALVECVMVFGDEGLSPDTAAQLRTLQVIKSEPILLWDEFDIDAEIVDAVVDAMLGTGAKGAPRGNASAAIEWANSIDAVRLAVEVPTGLDADTGAVESTAFRADATVTMGALKPGLVLGNGPIVVGELFVTSLGVPNEHYDDTYLWLLDHDEASIGLLPIEHDVNKYDNGKVLVVAGSRGMSGAGVLASEAALRSGCGLVVFAMPESALPLPQAITPEIMTRFLASDEHGAFAADAFDRLLEEIDGYDAIACGPGLSRTDGAAATVRALLARSKSPLVLDADALAPFNGRIDSLNDRDCELVITPHHGEMARLLGVESAEVRRDPVGIARAVSTRIDATVVLKGPETIVAWPDTTAYISSPRNPGMATAGCGDVLTGIIASFVAQNRDAHPGSVTGVYLHALAARLAVDRLGMRALQSSDIIEFLPAAIQNASKATTSQFDAWRSV